MKKSLDKVWPIGLIMIYIRGGWEDMKIAVINETSAGDKNKDIIAALKGNFSGISRKIN